MSEDRSRHGSSFWLSLGVILCGATLVSLTFNHGITASDDLVYFSRALDVSNNIWTSSDYIGSIRYGVNLPIGGAIAVFGRSLFAASVAPLASSLAEIAVVGVLARAAWGNQAGLCAAVVLAAVPLHISSATAIHADPILAMSITMACALFWHAERVARRSLYVATGIFVGFAYWVKEASIPFLATFLFYAAIARRWSYTWVYAAAAALVLFLLNCMLMWWISGDPLHVVRVAQSMVATSWTASTVADAPLYYFRYLFIDVRFTWLLAYVALAGSMFLWVCRHALDADARGLGIFVGAWLFGTLFIFSFLPVSLSPLQWIMKQSNYMGIFLAPLAVLAGFGLIRLHPRSRSVILFIVVIGGVVLAALSQQDRRAFLGNSRTADRYAAAHKDATVYGNEWNNRVSMFLALVRTGTARSRVLPFEELASRPDARPNTEIFAVLDRQTMPNAIAGRHRFMEPPMCWIYMSRLEPEGFGYGAQVTELLVRAAYLLPSVLSERVLVPFERLLHPAPAYVYAVPAADPWCNGGGAGP